MPEPGTANRLAGNLRLVARSALLIPHIAYGLLLALVVRLDFTGHLRREELGSHWSRIMLRIFGIDVCVHGKPMARGGLIVANHISWLDIPLIYACAPTRFVSKSEVEHWPVAGWLAEAAGTFYLRRGRNGSRPLLNQLIPYLRHAGSVVVFPEGTTTDGTDVLPFHPRLFCAAVESERPVQAVALRYGPGMQGESLAPFIGDDDLLSHILRLLRNRRMAADIHFNEALEPGSRSREELAETARESIRVRLHGPAPAAILVDGRRSAVVA